MIINGESKGIGKEAIVSYCKVLTQQCDWCESHCSSVLGTFTAK